MTITKAAVSAILLTAALASNGCGLVRDASPGTASTSAAGFPASVDNCGRRIDIDAPPTRVIALGPSQVTTLWAAGGADKLIARDDGGHKSDPYPLDLDAAVADVPQLGSGGGEVTRENFLDLDTDLVVGSVSESLSADSLAAVGIPMLSLRGDCGSNHAPGANDGTADFDDVTFDITQLGRLLGTEQQAGAAVADIGDRIARARARADTGGQRIAVVIAYDNHFKAYGKPSMAHTQLTALGATNVFGDVDSRAFDTNIEQLISRDPDQIVVLSYAETDQQALDTFLDIPGAATLRAVRTNALLVQPYEYSSQGFLSVTGLENMAARLRR